MRAFETEHPETHGKSCTKGGVVHDKSFRVVATGNLLSGSVDCCSQKIGAIRMAKALALLCKNGTVL